MSMKVTARLLNTEQLLVAKMTAVISVHGRNAQKNTLRKFTENQRELLFCYWKFMRVFTSARARHIQMNCAFKVK